MRQVFCFIFLCFILPLSSQSTSTYYWKIITPKSAAFKSKWLNSKSKSKEEIVAVSKKLLIDYQKRGYLLASFDSNCVKKDSIYSYLYTGNVYKWGIITASNDDLSKLEHAGFNKEKYFGQELNALKVAKEIESVLIFYENNGYPFTSVKMDSLEVGKNNTISLKLSIQLNKRIVIDSIVNNGSLSLRKNFVYHYLQLKPGSLYNEERIKGIQKKMKQLPFVKERQAQVVKIEDTGTKLYLFYDKKNASQFDGIIGLLPDPKGKTVFTGDAKIKLQNALLKSGELIELNWRRLQVQTQDLKIRLNYPFLFGLPIGTDYQLKLYRKDTSFIDILNTIGLQYLFSGLNNFSVHYKQRNAAILSTNGLESLSVLPPYADITTSSYGFGILLDLTDYRFNPRKGLSLSMNSGAGTRKIRKNPKLKESIYSNVKLNNSQYQGEMDFSGYLPIIRKACIRIGVKGAGIFSDELFQNEMYRIGGLKSLRGFDEESIYCTSFAIGSIEYRYLFEQNSTLFFFSDFCWYERNASNGYLSDRPISLGAGINFETKAGIFSLNYALGKQLNSSFDLRSGKIHFGLINTF